MTTIIADWQQKGIWFVRTMTRPHQVTITCSVSPLHLASLGRGVASPREEQEVAATEEDVVDAAVAGGEALAEEIQIRLMSLIRLRVLRPHQAEQSSSQPPVTRYLA